MLSEDLSPLFIMEPLPFLMGCIDYIGEGVVESSCDDDDGSVVAQ